MKVKALVTQLCPTLCDPLEHSLPGSSVHGDSPGKNTGVGCPPPGDLPNLGVESASLTSPALQAGSLPLKPPGKPVMSPLEGVLLSVAGGRCVGVEGGHRADPWAPFQRY